MDVTTWTESTVEVLVVRKIQLGHKYRISPSYGFAGITPGVVEVTGILDREYVANSSEIQDVIMNMADEDDTLRADLNNEIWIEYIYSHEVDELGNTYYFPLSAFVDHTSTTI